MGTAAAAVASHSHLAAAGALAAGYDRAFAITAVILIAAATLTPLLPSPGKPARPGPDLVNRNVRTSSRDVFR